MPTNDEPERLKYIQYPLARPVQIHTDLHSKRAQRPGSLKVSMSIVPRVPRRASLKPASTLRIYTSTRHDSRRDRLKYLNHTPGICR